MRILIVEDEVRLARQIAAALTEAGHDPAVVHDGKAALSQAAQTFFDLLSWILACLSWTASKCYVACDRDASPVGF